MDYSVSTFGDIPYDQEVNVQLIVAPDDDIEGCEVLEKPSNLKAEKFIWFVKRGKMIFLLIGRDFSKVFFLCLIFR